MTDAFRFPICQCTRKNVAVAFLKRINNINYILWCMVLRNYKFIFIILF